MEVNIDNIEQMAPEILNNLKNSQIMAIDLEMSGIFGEQRLQQTDLPIKRFYKIKQIPKKYEIIQFGISLFQKNKNQYDNYTYYFYLFPPSFNDHKQRFINMDLSSIQFLKDMGSINFQEWITKGIHFQNQDQIKYTRKYIFRNQLYDLIRHVKDKKKSTKIDIMDEGETKEMNFEIKSFIDHINNKDKEEFILKFSTFRLKKIFFKKVYQLKPDFLRKSLSKNQEIIYYCFKNYQKNKSNKKQKNNQKERNKNIEKQHFFTVFGKK